MRSLVILLDTVRRDFLHCYGNSWVRTPNIDRLVDRSVVFENHYAGSLPCMPARRDIMTGRQHFLHGTWGGLEPYDDSLPQTLRQAGVFSHMATDHYHYFHVGGENYVDQFDTWDFQRGQEHDKWVSTVDRPALPDFAAPSKQSVQNWCNRRAQRREEDYSGPRTVRGAVDWLASNASSDDWFLMVELFDPHEPFMVPEEYLREYGDDWTGKPFDWPVYGPCQESPDLVEHVRRRYAALLTMTDRWLGRLFDQLEADGVYEDTLIILTTDHGTCLGDHGFWMKNYFPVYQEIAHIPLIVHLPGDEGAGEHCTALTQTHDLFRTLCRHHGAEAPEFAMGVALQDAYSGEQRRQAGLFGYFGAAVNVTDGRYVYMRNPVRADDQPLYLYTAMPSMPPVWNGREHYGDIETGRWFRFARDLPLYRMPMRNPNSCQTIFEEAGGPGIHQLYDTVADSGQEHALTDPDQEEEMIEHLTRLMVQLDAPPEQFERLGLTPVA